MMNHTIINEAAHRIVQRFHPMRVILFGSQARGSADARSDVDLLVILDFEGDRRELALRIDRSLRGLGVARDVVVMRPEEFEQERHVPGTVARPASLEGRVLYQR